jgi:UPF0176 protein
MIAILSFYGFVNIEEPELLLPKILYIGKRKHIKGTILLANEGFNGSISGEEGSLKFLLEEIKDLTGNSDVNVKINYANSNPFFKLKVKLKPEIVALGVGSINVEELKGEYIATKDWDEFISREDVIVIDARNNYETAIGTFKDAIDPGTDTFRQFPTWVEENKHLLENKKIAMCCTGGIRCEKSTAYLKMQGFEEVYHLKGGILQYLEDTKNAANLWKGACFVFDDRFAVDDDLGPVKHYCNVSV